MIRASDDERLRSRPPLIEPEDLDLDQVLDVAIGLEDGPGGRFLAHHRVLLPLRAALPLAQRVARAAAERKATRLVGTPPALRVVRQPGAQGVMLDYDVHAHPPLRVVMIARPLRAA